MDRTSSLRAINHNLLPILWALLREQSVTRAAETLGLTQPAASAALGKLRLILNDPLLVKVGRRLERSPRADALLPEIEDLCIRLEQLWRDPQFDPATSDRCFTLTSPDYVQAVLAPRLVERIAAQAPRMSLRFLDVPVDDVTRHKVDNVDFIVSIRQALEHPAMANFTVERLFVDREVAVVGPGHRLYSAEPSQAHDYRNDKVLTFIGGAHFLEKRYSQLRNSLGGAMRSLAVSQHYNSMLLIAAQSDCVALVPRTLASVACGLMGLKVIDSNVSNFPIEVCLASDRRYQSDPAHAWIGSQIKQIAGDLDERDEGAFGQVAASTTASGSSAPVAVR